MSTYHQDEIDKWIEQNCQCGVDENGKWSETLFEEFGCTCRENADGES